MPSRSSTRVRPSFALAASALAAALVLLGALHWYKPFLTRRSQPVVSVAVPPALDALSFVTLRSGAPVCMASVTITSNSRYAQFSARPLDPRSATLSPIELVLTGADYRSAALDSGGTPGVQTQSIDAPSHTVLGGFCLVNRGRRPVALYGTGEPRTLSRAATTVGGVASPTEVSLQFLGARPRSLLDRLGEVFGHASNLTDHLAPVWLIWIVAVLVALGVPAALLVGLYLALREPAGEALSAPDATRGC